VEGVHAVSLRLPSGGGLRDAEGGLGAQMVEPVGELLHAVLLRIELITAMAAKLPTSIWLIHD
jgi:hypothetical protein